MPSGLTPRRSLIMEESRGRLLGSTMRPPAMLRITTLFVPAGPAGARGAVAEREQDPRVPAGARFARHAGPCRDHPLQARGAGDGIICGGGRGDARWSTGWVLREMAWSPFAVKCARVSSKSRGPVLM